MNQFLFKRYTLKEEVVNSNKSMCIFWFMYKWFFINSQKNSPPEQLKHNHWSRKCIWELFLKWGTYFWNEAPTLVRGTLIYHSQQSRNLISLFPLLPTISQIIYFTYTQHCEPWSFLSSNFVIFFHPCHPLRCYLGRVKSRSTVSSGRLTGQSILH